MTPAELDAVERTLRDPAWRVDHIRIAAANAIAALRADAAIGYLVRQKMNSLNGIPMDRCVIRAEEIAAIDAARASLGADHAD